MKDIREIAYEKYKLNWLIYHGYTLNDLIRELQLLKEESDPDMSLQSLFEDWEFGFGFGSEIWVCYEEFLGAEFLDNDYMSYLLTEQEYEEYLKVL